MTLSRAFWINSKIERADFNTLATLGDTVPIISRYALANLVAASKKAILISVPD